MSSAAEDERSDAAPRARSRPGRVLWALVGVAALAAALSWVAATKVADGRRASEAPKAPEAPVLTATVEEGELVDEIRFDGTITSDLVVRFPAPALADGELPVVTDAPAPPGTEVAEGSRLVSVADRPVLLLQGDLRPYRDLRPGLRGPDVAQLRAALTRLGLVDPSASDLFDGAVSGAVRDLYEASGATATEHVPEGPTEPELEQAVAAAEAAAESVRLGGDAAAYAAAVAERTSARQALTAHREASGPIVPASELAIVPTTPMTVASGPTKPGGLIAEDKPAIVLAGVTGHLAASVPAGKLDRVDVAAAVTIQAADGVHTGIVERIGEPSDDTGLVPVRIALADGGGGLAVDEVVNASIMVEQQSGLVVPISATNEGNDGTSAVVRIDDDGGTHRVEIEIGLVVDGAVAVTVTEGDLAAGDQVLLGPRR